MFSDDILCKIFAHKEMQCISVGCQSTVVHVFEEILEDILEVNPYEPIQSLFEPTTNDE